MVEDIAMRRDPQAERGAL